MKKNIFDYNHQKTLFENFFSLSFLQVANYIFPVITLPYLVRILGPEKYGLIAFAQAFVGYFAILTDYGFNLSATREVSINRENKQKISEIFSSVLLIKFCLLLVSFILLTLIVFSFSKFKKDFIVYYLTFGMVLGQVLFPVWFFQGMERMKYITILNLIAKLIFTISIFIFIRKTADYVYVPLLNSLGFITSGILSLFIISINFKTKFFLPTAEQIIHQLKEGWHIFISTVAISLYTISNTFILGLFTNNTIVGYYSAAEKLIRVVQGLLNPISQTVYPHISKLVAEAKENGIRFIRKITVFIGNGSFLLSLLICIFAAQLVRIILGEEFSESIAVLRILSFLPFIIALSNIFGIQTMLNFNLKKEFSTILIIAAFINLSLTFALVPFYKHIGISVAILITELFVTTTMFIYLLTKGINILKGRIIYV